VHKDQPRDDDALLYRTLQYPARSDISSTELCSLLWHRMTVTQSTGHLLLGTKAGPLPATTADRTCVRSMLLPLRIVPNGGVSVAIVYVLYCTQHPEQSFHFVSAFGCVLLMSSGVQLRHAASYGSTLPQSSSRSPVRLPPRLRIFGKVKHYPPWVHFKGGGLGNYTLKHRQNPRNKKY
jgi:hypothetical protein